VPESLSQLIEVQSRVARRDQLRAVGVTPSQIRSHIHGGRWRPLGSVVVVLHNGPLERLQQMWAGVLASGPDATLAALTALESAGLRNWLDPRVHVLLTRAAGIARSANLPVVVHRSAVAQEPGVFVHRPPRSTVERAAIDAGSWLRNTRSCAGLLAAVVQQRLTTPARLMAALDKAGPIRHRRLIRLTIGDIEGGAEALSEIDFARFCRRRRLGTVVRQQVRVDVGGRRRYLDGELVGPNGKRLPFEIDGGIHMLAEQHASDLERQNELLIAKSFPLRFTSYAVRWQQDRVADQVRRALAS
jgi:very-short-patch-repair endonuclease